MKLEELNMKSQKFNDWINWWKRESLRALSEAKILNEKDEDILAMDDETFKENLVKWERIKRRISFLDKNGAETVEKLKKFKNEVGNFFIEETFSK